MSDPDRTLVARREVLRHAALALGGAISAPTLAAVLAGCTAESADATWRPRALDTAQGDLLAITVDHIIPPTSTPGARGAGVHRFIDTMLADFYTPAERQRFVDGLTALDARARRECGKRFVRCSPAAQRLLLERIDRESFARTHQPSAADVSRETERGGAGGADSKAPAPPTSAKTVGDTPFFRTLKELTIVGYYTSKPGATQELQYVAVPGRFDGCVPLSKLGRAFSI